MQLISKNISTEGCLCTLASQHMNAFAETQSKAQAYLKSAQEVFAVCHFPTKIFGVVI